jgi:hypothetical protein
MKQSIRIIPVALLFLCSSAFGAELRLLDPPAEPGSLAPTWTQLSDGRAVLAWLQGVDEGHAFRFAVFDGDGFGPVGEIARGSDWFANWADTPGLFALPNGDWLAHWLVKSGQSTYAYDVVMSRSSDQGSHWSAPFSPHDDGTQTEHGFVSYFAWSPETAGVVWLDGRETAPGNGHASDDDHHGHHGPGAMTLRTAGVGRDSGLSRSALLDERVCDCCQTAAAMTEDGPVVIYRGRSADEIRDIRIVRWQGDQWSGPTTIHDDGWQIGGCPVNGPALIGRDRGLVAAWFTMADGRPLVRLATSNDAGLSFSDPQELGADQALGRVDLAWYRSGFVVSWLNQTPAGSELMLAGFDEQGEIDWQQSLTTLDAGRVSGFPRLAVLPDERILITWTASDPDLGAGVRAAVLDLGAGDRDRQQ